MKEQLIALLCRKRGHYEQQTNRQSQTPYLITAHIHNILTPLIKQGQSMEHIYATHAEELGCSRRTAYTYIGNGVFDIMNLDLRRKVKYKKRKKSTA